MWWISSFLKIFQVHTQYLSRREEPDDELNKRNQFIQDREQRENTRWNDKGETEREEHAKEERIHIGMYQYQSSWVLVLKVLIGIDVLVVLVLIGIGQYLIKTCSNTQLYRELR